MKLFPLFVLSMVLTACSGRTSPFSVEASFSVPFGGRYLFLIELHTKSLNATPLSVPNFVEGGIIMVDQNGGLNITATYNATPLNTVPATPIVSPNIIQGGTYKFDRAGGFGSITVPGAQDAFSSLAYVFCKHDGEYCSLQSAEDGRAWQGRMWRDDSSNMNILSIAELSGSYVFESDSSQNFFTEAGILSFDGAGKITLASAFNNTIPVSIIPPPGQVWASGTYTANSNYGHLAQIFCSDGSVTDTTAFYCFNDASRCVFVPDLNEVGGWIGVGTRQ